MAAAPRAFPCCWDTAVAEPAHAFAQAAASYDADFGVNPVGLLFRHVFQQRLRAAFPAGGRLLDVGCGTGDDALFLASLGFEVTGLDPAAGMVALARAKAAARGLQDRAAFVAAPAEDVSGGLFEAASFDGVYSDFGALNCLDLAALGRGLARVTRPGSAVILSLLGPRPLPATLRRALLGLGQARGASAPRIAGQPVSVRYPDRREVARSLGPAFAWERSFALGVLVPGPEHADVMARNPQLFGVLAAAESLVRSWPLLRGLGDHLVLEGRRR
jgi:SAM-dependent methyltransferase